MSFESDTWWQIYPLGACGAPIRQRTGDDGGHRLRRLLNWVDYAADLGATGLLLAPIFESVAHGYDTLDHYRIDSRLGDDTDFADLIAALQARGMGLMLDGVFNHVAREHPFVTQGGPIKRNPDGTHRGWEGDNSLAEIDHSDPAAVDWVVDIMNYWLDKGITGWRLDVAYAVPTEFWAQVTDRVRQTHPDAIFLGEMIHGDYPQFGLDSHLTTVTQYELWKAIWSSLNDKNFFELSHALGRHQEFSDRQIMQIFVGNHDVARIATTVGPVKAALAAVVLFTLPGIPSVYYGDEQGFQGSKGEGFSADDELRAPLPDSPDELSPLGGWMYEHYQRLIALRKSHPQWATSRIEVLETANEKIRYRIGNSTEVEVSLGELGQARITDGGEEIYSASWGLS